MCPHNHCSADTNINNRTTTTMAPNFAHHKRVLIHSLIDSKLQSDDGPNNNEIADIAGCTVACKIGIPPLLLKILSTNHASYS